MGTEKFLNIDEALDRMRGKKELFARMLKMFLASEEFPAFEESITAGDLARASDLAHAIKGVSGNLSMPFLFEASTKILGELRDGAYAPETLAEYRAAFDGTVKRVNELLASDEYRA